MKKPILRILLFVLVTVGGTRPAFACSCPDYPAFEAVAKESAIVLEGRVLRVVSKVAGWRSFEPDRLSPVFIDVEVVRVLKGSVVSSRIRIWDDRYGSSCEGVLSQLTEGTAAVLALTIVSEEKAREGRRLGAPVPAGEFVLPHCRQAYKKI